MTPPMSVAEEIRKRKEYEEMPQRDLTIEIAVQLDKANKRLETGDTIFQELKSKCPVLKGETPKSECTDGHNCDTDKEIQKLTIKEKIIAHRVKIVVAVCGVALAIIGYLQVTGGV